MGKPKELKINDPKPLEAVAEPQRGPQQRPIERDKSPLAQAQSSHPNFEDWYLKQVTNEFADDIDKIRNAADFNDKSVPILVAALKQGASLFSEEERGIVIGSHSPREKGFSI